MEQKLLGIDLGGTSIKFAIVTRQGDVQQKWSIATNILEDGRFIVPDIIASIQEHLTRYGMSANDFIGIGMGSPGQVDRAKGTVIGAYNLNWRNEQLVKKQIEAALAIPVFIDNDANVAALGEQWLGAGDSEPDVVFVTLGTGVGGGIIADGRLLHGKSGSAGEIGHIVVEPHGGIRCTCGKHGCLETVASATGIVTLAHQLAETYAGDATLKARVDDGQQVTAKDVFDLAKEGDALAKMVVAQFAHYLGVACSHLANVLNPAFIVIGGGVSAAGAYLLEQVRAVFLQHTFPQAAQTTKLKLAQLGNDAGVIGVAFLVLTEQKKSE